MLGPSEKPRLSKRILHVMQCANLGGMEQTTLLRMNGLMRRGNRCRLVSLNEVAGLGPLLEDAHIPYVGLKYRLPWGIPGILEMRRAFRADPPEALMMTGHNASAMIALGSLCRDHRMLCIHFHHAGVKARQIWRLIYRIACDTFPVITFPSEFIRAEAEDIYPPLRPVSTILPNPFVVPRSTPSENERSLARQSLGLPSDGFVVGNAGWLIKRKRWDVFLRVAHSVLRQRPDAVFAIAGGGPELGRLRGLTVELGIDKSVVWLGWLADMDQFYGALDVLLFNSDWDALGRTPIEAAAYGVPVVASVVNGGLSEFLRDGADAYISKTHDVEDLASKVVSLTDRALARGMVRSARDQIAERLSPERDADSVSSLLRLDMIPS